MVACTGGWATCLGWLAAAGGPPVAVAVAWQDLVLDYSAILAVLLLAIASLTMKIVRELLKRWLETIVDGIDRSTRRWFSRFSQRYRKFVLSSLRFIDTKGLATVGDVTPELDEVFVDVSLAPRAPHQVPGGLLPTLPTEVTERHSLGDFLDRPKPVVLAVVGAPGSGKTTLLRHTARRVAGARWGRRRTVPILLYLRDHIEAITKAEVTLPELLRGTLGHYRDDEPDGWFEKQLRDGDCVVLFDGLDEVARPQCHVA